MTINAAFSAGTIDMKSAESRLTLCPSLLRVWWPELTWECPDISEGFWEAVEEDKEWRSCSPGLPEMPLWCPFWHLEDALTLVSVTPIPKGAGFGVGTV